MHVLWGALEMFDFPLVLMTGLNKTESAVSYIEGSLYIVEFKSIEYLFLEQKYLYLYIDFLWKYSKYDQR